MHKIVSYSHIAFNAHDAENLISFYCDKLGMKVKFTLTTDGIIEFSKYQAAQGIEPSEKAKGFIQFASSHPGIPMITYIEIAYHQYLELFHVRELLEEPGLLADQYGYQHLAIQVENLKDTYDEMIRRGVEPDTEINQGPDYTWQFWIHDPDGNRIEFMEYSELSLQL